jgi:threonine dehydratase
LGKALSDGNLLKMLRIFVSVGGGGLIAGIAAWYAGAIKIIGVEPFASPTLTKAFEAGRPVDAEAGGLAADSLAPQRVGEKVFPIAKAYVHSTVLVTDEAIRQAQKMLPALCVLSRSREEQRRSLH